MMPAMITLHIGAQETVVTVAAGAAPPLVLSLPLGSARTAAAHFRHQPPTEAEIENAIQEVEDVVMPLHRQLAPGSALASADDAVREIALLAGVADGPAMVLPVEAMERVFDRLAAVVTGSTATRQGLPAGGEFAAALLILREFMHHLKFASITWARR